MALVPASGDTGRIRTGGWTAATDREPTAIASDGITDASMTAIKGGLPVLRPSSRADFVKVGWPGPIEVGWPHNAVSAD